MTIAPDLAKELAMAGANITIMGGRSPVALVELATICKSSGAHFTIHTKGYAPQMLRDIVRIGGSSVTIVIDAVP